MRILIVGATGLIGKHLKKELINLGHSVDGWSYSSPTPSENIFHWDPYKNIFPEDTSYETIIFLSGANIGKKRWTASFKREIFASRIDALHHLIEYLESKNNHTVKNLFIASGCAYYGDQGDTPLDETHPAGSGFLAFLSQKWEERASQNKLNLKVIFLRFGMILSLEGKGLKEIVLPFKLGLGAILGDGSQFFSWITLEDSCRAISHILQHINDFDKAVNIVAPGVCTNAQFSLALALKLHRPLWLKIPPFILNLLFGEMAKEILLSSQNSQCKKLLESSFTFKHPTIEEALNHLL